MLVVLKECKLQLNHATSDFIEVYQTKTHIAKNELLWMGNVAVLKTFAQFSCVDCIFKKKPQSLQILF